MSRGWIVGIDGVILFSENGGKNWKKLKSPVGTSLYKIRVVNDRGYAVGLRGNYLTSEDGGRAWMLQKDALDIKFWLMGLAFSNDNHGWIVGAKGTILHTKDGGKSWKIVSGISIPEE